MAGKSILCFIFSKVLACKGNFFLFNNSTINDVDSVKFLGLVIDDSVKWFLQNDSK